MRVCTALVAGELDFGNTTEREESGVEDLFGYGVVETACDMLASSRESE